MSYDIAVCRQAARSIPRAGVLTVALLTFLCAPTPPAEAQAARAGQQGDTTLSVQIDSLLDLQTVVRRALEVSPVVAAGIEAIRGAQSEGRVTAAAYVPSLAATSSIVRSNVTAIPVVGSQPSSYSAGLASSIDVFTGGRRGADRERARADLTAAKADDVSRRFAVTLAAQRAFYETLRAADLVDVARARVAQAERGYRYAQDRVRAGTTTRSDELRARLELTTGRQQLLGALDTLQTAAYTLGRLVGANGPVGALRDSTSGARPLALTDSEIVRLAVDASPAVRTARANERASAAATKSARTLYVPDLRVTGGYNWANQTQIVGGTRPGWSVALGTSFPLFNGFEREDAITRSDAAAEVARVSTLDVIRQARAEGARLLSGLRFADRAIVLSNEAVQSAQEDLRVQSERYQAGISTELDQLTSQLALTQARLGLVAARFNYLITRAQLEALIGREL